MRSCEYKRIAAISDVMLLLTGGVARIGASLNHLGAFSTGAAVSRDKTGDRVGKYVGTADISVGEYVGEYVGEPVGAICTTTPSVGTTALAPCWVPPPPSTSTGSFVP